MQRSDAISDASKFLGRKHDVKTGGTAKRIKRRASDNDDLNRARLNQIVADIYQRGVDPKDLDLEKIDWSVSYQNIRGQVKNLLDKRGVDSFNAEKRRKRKATMDYAAKKGSEQLKTVANVRHERRDPHSQYVDETKEAERKFGRLTDSAYRKWSKNPNKYDIEGVDGKKQKGRQQPLPFRRKQKIHDLRMSNVEQDLSEPVEEVGLNQGSVAFTDSKKLDMDIGGESVKISDSRSSKEVSKSMRGGTKEKSTQQGLREGGYVSKKSEKTLDKWDGNYV